MRGGDFELMESRFSSPLWDILEESILHFERAGDGFRRGARENDKSGGTIIRLDRPNQVVSEKDNGPKPERRRALQKGEGAFTRDPKPLTGI